jgi:hypothetical protein
VDTYRILISENPYRRFEDLYNSAKELKRKAPQIDWVVGEEKMLNVDDKYESHLCMKVPKVQYEAAKHLYYLVIGSGENKFLNDPIFNNLEDNLSYLAHFCSFPVKEDEFEECLNKLSTVLSEIYSIGTQLRQGINLHLNVEHDEPYEHFPNVWILNEDLFQEEINIIRENITFILYETSKYSPFVEEETNLLEAGIVYETYQSFHSLTGWGMLLLETVTLIHQLKNKLLETNDTNHSQIKGASLKKAAILWIKDLISNNNFFQRNEYVGGQQVTNLFMDYNNLFSFPLIGFADRPVVFVQPTIEGIKFGYHTIHWEHAHHPTPALAIKHIVTWESLEHLTQEERETTVIDTFLKIISSRKRQYRTCQFCGDKVSPEHRFNTRTCHGCAAEHFGVIY